MDWKRILIGKWSWKRPFISLASIYLLLALFAVSCADRIIFQPPTSSYGTTLAGLEKLETEEGESIAFIHHPPAAGNKTLWTNHNWGVRSGCSSREPRHTGIHRKLFRLDEAAIHQAYFRYLANYKVAIIVFNIVPYFALRIMG